jgi:hypothetical protein
VSEPATARPPPPARVAFAFALSAYLGVAVWLLWRTAILEPFSDMFDWIVRYQRFRGDGDLIAYLWAPDNFHHLVWTFGILDLDIRLFGASSYFIMAVGVACLVLTTVMLARTAADAAGPGLRLVGAAGAIGFCALGCYAQDANVDINGLYVHTVVFAVAAILLAEAAAGDPKGGAAATGRRLGALVCAVAAGLGSAGGLAIWPALAFSAWRRRAWGWLAAVLVTGSVFSLVFLIGQFAPLNPAAGLSLTQRVIDGLALSVNYLGLPWMRGLPAGGWMIGLAVLVAMGGAVLLRGGPAAPRPERIGVALIVFSLSTAVMAGIARNGVTDPQMAPMRYAIFMMPADVGLWILAAPFVRRWWVARPRWLEAGFLAAAVIMLGVQGLMADYAIRTSDINRRVIADFHAGRRSERMLTPIYPDLAKADALSALMKRQSLYQIELSPDPAP